LKKEKLVKIDVSLRTRDLRHVAQLARQYENLGYGTLWTSEVGHCPFLPHAVAALNTSRIGLGTNIAISFVRAPLVTAYTAWDLHRASGGRFQLGLGTQVRAHNERRYSVPWEHPAPKVRDLIECIRAIWNCWQNGTRAAFEGRFYRFTLQTPATNPGPLDHPFPPIWLAAVNPLMCRMAGEVADGIQVHPLHSVRYLEEVVRPAVTEGARRRHRTPESLRFFASLFVVTGRSEDERRRSDASTRERIAYYASTPGYRGVFDLHGWGDVADELKLMVRRGEWERIASKITDEMLDTFAIVAPPEQLAERILARYQGKLDAVSLYFAPSPNDPEAWWQEFVGRFAA
jgi:probable F420-dependent oxidoreductase